MYFYNWVISVFSKTTTFSCNIFFHIFVYCTNCCFVLFFQIITYAGLQAVSFGTLSLARDNSISCGRMEGLAKSTSKLQWGPKWLCSTRCLRATPIQHILNIDPLLIHRYPDNWFILLWFLAAVSEEWVDGFGRCELNTWNTVCIVCILLFDVLLPKSLVEGLLFCSADQVSNNIIYKNKNVPDSDDGIMLCLPGQLKLPHPFSYNTHSTLIQPSFLIILSAPSTNSATSTHVSHVVVIWELIPVEHSELYLECALILAYMEEEPLILDGIEGVSDDMGAALFFCWGRWWWMGPCLSLCVSL